MADQSSNHPSPAAGKRDNTLVIRSWPKVILLLPTLFASLICGILISLAGDLSPELTQGAWKYVGVGFLLVLGINLTILLYDLNLRGFIIVSLFIAVILLGLSLLDRNTENDTGIWNTIGNMLSVGVVANSAFYFVLSFILAFNLFIAWIITRFNYWKVEHNEIIIHKGFMQEQERHPTAQARFKLQIEDIVEYGILGSGTLVFYFGDDSTEHELPTVLFVHRKAKKLDELLGRVAVVSQG